ncbi:MAG: hypothetical protein ACRDPD_11930 [Streptosporangiaceae bacterium]
MGNDEAAEVIRRAERIVLVPGWQQRERAVLRQLAGTRGLAWGRLEPRSEVIQLVTYDGEHLGHVRREGNGSDERWVAVRKNQAHRVGMYASAAAAAAALARSCGKTAGIGG